MYRMRNKTERYTTSEFFVVVAYCLYISFEILNYTQFKGITGWVYIHRAVEVLVASMVIVGILTKTRQNLKWLILSTIIIGTGLIIVAYNDRLINTAILMLFIVAGNCIYDEKIFRFHWIIVSSLVAFTLFMYVIGVYKPDYILRVTLTERTQRAYLGFSYTSYPPNYLIHLMITFFASRKKQIQIRETVIFLIINYVFFKYTATYAVFYEVLLMIICLWLLKYYGGIFASKAFGILSVAFMPLMAAAALWLSVIYTPYNKTLQMLNHILSDRLSLAHTGIERYGLKLFGNPVVWSGGRYGIERFTEYFYVDSSYVNIALTYGLVTLVFVVLCFAVLNYKAYKMGNYKLCVVLIFLAMHSFTDPQLLELKYNPFLVILLAAFIPGMDRVLTMGLIEDEEAAQRRKRRRFGFAMQQRRVVR